MEDGGKEVVHRKDGGKKVVHRKGCRGAGRGTYPLQWRLAHKQRGLAGAHVPNTLVAPVPQPDKGSKEQG